MNIKIKPVYQHDCNECIFVGADIPLSDESKVNQIDMYVHITSSSSSITVIRRYSSVPEDYAAATLSKNVLLSYKYRKVIVAALRQGLIREN